MTARGQNPPGTPREGAANFREGGEIAKAHGVRFALEFNSQHELINRLEAGREIVALADHPNCGLLFDAYHLERSGGGGRSFEDVAPGEIFGFQYSDVPGGLASAAKRHTQRHAAR